MHAAPAALGSVAAARAFREDPRRDAAVATSVARGVLTILRLRAKASFFNAEYVMQRLGTTCTLRLIPVL